MTKRAKTYKTPLRSGNAGPMLIDGLPVVDAKEALVLEVTDNDIRDANRLDPGHCAAALAVMRQEHVSKAYVYRSKVYILRKGKWNKQYFERYETPKSLRIEAGGFDKGAEFEPNEFKLNAPYPSQTKEGKTAYRLQVPGGQNALPLKSNWKRNGKTKYEKTGKKARRYVVTKVRPMPPRDFGNG